MGNDSSQSNEERPGQAGWSRTALQDEQRSRWQRGDPVLVEELLREHTGLQDDPEGLLELLYHEVLLREQKGESPRLEEYVKRFPHLADPLKDQFEVHRAMESTGALLSKTAATNIPAAKARAAEAVSDSASLTRVLCQLHLLEANQLNELAGLEARFPDPKALAGELIRRGWLTPYQANQLLHHKGRELVLGPHNSHRACGGFSLAAAPEPATQPPRVSAHRPHGTKRRRGDSPCGFSSSARIDLSPVGSRSFSQAG